VGEFRAKDLSSKRGGVPVGGGKRKRRDVTILKGRKIDKKRGLHTKEEERRDPSPFDCLERGGGKLELLG